MAVPEFILWPDGTTIATAQIIQLNRQDRALTLILTNGRAVSYTAANANIAAAIQAYMNTVAIFDATAHPVIPPSSTFSMTISPAYGPNNTGIAFSLTANGFLFSLGGSVTIGASPISSGYSITDGGMILTAATTPGNLAKGDFDVVYTFPDGTTTVTITNGWHSQGFAFSVATGPEAGGTSVTLTATNFLFDAAGSVTFGGAPATGYTIGGGGATVALDTPAGVGVVDVVYIPPTGDSITQAAAFTYT